MLITLKIAHHQGDTQISVAAAGMMPIHLPCDETLGKTGAENCGKSPKWGKKRPEGILHRLVRILPHPEHCHTSTDLHTLTHLGSHHPERVLLHPSTPPRQRPTRHRSAAPSTATRSLPPRWPPAALSPPCLSVPGGGGPIPAALHLLNIFHISVAP